MRKQDVELELLLKIALERINELQEEIEELEEKIGMLEERNELVNPNM